MDKCRDSIKSLKNKSSTITEKDKEILAAIKAGDEGLKDEEKIINNDYVLNNAKAIVVACDKISNEESKHNLTLALNLAKSTVGLGAVGTMTSLAGAITSGIAGTDKGKDKAKALDLTTSIMAGVSSGTHGAATATGSISAVKLKALRDDAKTCQAALNQ